MGWSWYHATNYKAGEPDILKEVESLLNWENDKTVFSVIRSSSYGSTVYSAVKKTDKETGKEDVFAAVFLTGIDTRENYFNFGYKDMDETMGPYSYDCPACILDLLTETENEYAKKWREKCRERIAEKKARKTDKNSLNNLPEGSVIEFNYWEGGTKTVEKRLFCKNYRTGRISYMWTDGCFRYRPGDIERHGYKVISYGENAD